KVGSTSEFSTCDIPFVINSTDDEGDNNPGDGIATTGQTITDGRLECTLRSAIQEANALAGAQAALFDIPGAGVHTITAVAPLPSITQPLAIDATSQPGYAPGSPL